MELDLLLDEKKKIGKEELLSLKEAAGGGPVLIMTRHNPGPDGLAAGKALGKLLDKAWGISSRRIYSGTIDTATNRAVLQLLTPGWSRVDAPKNFDRYSAIALVNTQPGSGNNCLPIGTPVHIIFDHHRKIRGGKPDLRYADIREELAATSTSVYLHLVSAGIKIGRRVASSLFYAIMYKTNGLSRRPSPADIFAYIELQSRIEPKVLSRVLNARLPIADYPGFIRGISSARIHGRVVVAHLGPIHRPDFPAENCQLLIRIEGIKAVLCTGIYADTLHLSLSISDQRQYAGSVMNRIMGKEGRAGGDKYDAGGQIKLNGNIAEITSTVGRVTQSFLALMRQPCEGVSLLSTDVRI